ncbi:MAG: hypothetical protein LBH04_00715 [Tannerellaceae bacterium]|jgi:dienelactone hydrolase|nr:hypothetical protein [Tannerellaceae bacterium]
MKNDALTSLLTTLSTLPDLMTGSGAGAGDGYIDEQSSGAISQPFIPKTHLYSYKDEEVVFRNPSDNVVLNGTLRLPVKDGTHPAAIIINGIKRPNSCGQTNSEIISDALAGNGIATLTYDDRVTSDAADNFHCAPRDFATDMEAALLYLMTRKEIDKRRVGLIGDNEGAVIAPIVAARNTSVAFLILLGGIGLRGDDIQLLQYETLARASGINEEMLQMNLAESRKTFSIINQCLPLCETQMQLLLLLRSNFQNNPFAEMISSDSADFLFQLEVERLSSPWQLFFIRHDPTTVMEKIKCPVLVLNGGKDVQVPAEANVAAICQALARGGNRTVTAKILPDLNHLFQECKTGLPAEYVSIKHPLSPIVHEEILQWLRKQFKQ